VNLPDIINGLFEMSGGFFILLSVRQVMRDKIVRGVSWLHVGFFSGWGVWNIYYYYNLSQWFSWYAGIWLCCMNCLYLYLLIYYSRKEKHDQEDIQTFHHG
jgi:uncharacterized membrane protein YfcA